MKRALQQIKDLVADVVRAARDRALEILRRQPVRVATAIAALVVAVIPGVVSEEALAEVLAKVIALLAGGEALKAGVFSPATVDRLTKRSGRG